MNSSGGSEAHVRSAQRAICAHEDRSTSKLIQCDISHIQLTIYIDNELNHKSLNSNRKINGKTCNKNDDNLKDIGQIYNNKILLFFDRYIFFLLTSTSNGFLNFVPDDLNEVVIELARMYVPK